MLIIISSVLKPNLSSTIQILRRMLGKLQPQRSKHEMKYPSVLLINLQFFNSESIYLPVTHRYNGLLTLHGTGTRNGMRKGTNGFGFIFVLICRNVHTGPTGIRTHCILLSQSHYLYCIRSQSSEV